MIKAELLAAMEGLPDDFEIMVDGEGLSDLRDVLVDKNAGVIVLEGS
jgi:hypothetical protein